MTGTSKKYEIHSEGRLVSTQFSASPLQAVVDYVRSYSVKDDEITRLGVDCVSWQGARFKAVLVPTESPLMPLRTAAGLAGRMTREQRDFLRRQIDARRREHLGERVEGRTARPGGHVRKPPKHAKS